MKILKSTFFKKVKSDYGNFDFKPDEGYELRTYIDFESKLIVVEESPIKKPSGVPYSPKQYIVDPKEGEILKFDEYKKYFNYELQEIVSEDGKFKLEYQRKHDEKTGKDYREEKLIELESDKVISTGKGIVFHADKLKNALERHYDNLERRRVQAEKIAAQKTLDEHYELCKEKLINDRFILGYFDQQQVFKIIYSGEQYILFEAIKTSLRNLNEAEFKEKSKFESLDIFWRDFTKDDKWYLNYSPFKNGIEFKEDRIIAKFIINEANKIRKKGDFTKEEYMKLNAWENQVYTETIRRNEYKQYCSNCGNERSFSARYPKCICGNCYDLTTDKNGRKVTFYNTELMVHGCQGYFVDVEPKEKYDSNICYIGDDEFYAEEARFGGIVIQKKE